MSQIALTASEGQAQPGRERQLPSATWVTRSFLDYRLPVFAALDRILEGGLTLIYSTLWTPPRVQHKVASILGPRAIGLAGERRWGDDGRSQFANSRICIPYQPGLYRAIAETRPDLLIGDGFFRWTPAAIHYKLLHRKRLVLCYEKTRHTERNAQWFRSLYRRVAIRCADAMSCNGQLCSEYTLGLGMPEHRITRGHMAADVETLRENSVVTAPSQRAEIRRSLSVQGACFLYVGRLIPLKGLRQLLTGWKELEQNRPAQATLVIIGEGEENAPLRGLANELGLRAVRFVGAVDYERIASYYSAADALVMPTLEDNWSLVVPEAMACGLPILCSCFNGCWPELVQPEENGWVFDPLDSASLIGALTQACDAGPQLSNMGRRSREIIQNHTPQRAAESIWEACQIALQAERSGTRHV